MPALNTTHHCTWGQISLFPALNAMVLTWLSLLNSCKKHRAYATTRDEIIFSLTSATILQLKTPAILKWLFSKLNFNHFLVHACHKKERTSVHKFNFFSAYTLQLTLPLFEQMDWITKMNPDLLRNLLAAWQPPQGSKTPCRISLTASTSLLTKKIMVFS